MKFPICEKCLKNELLCEECAKKVGKKLIKIDEILAYRQLNKYTEKYDILKDVEIHRIVDSPNMLLIITDKQNASKIIGKNGGMVNQLSQELGKPIRVVSEISTLEKLVDEIFYNMHIIGINVTYGEKDQYKVRIPLSEKEKIPIEPEKFSKIAYSMFGVKAELVFE
jgi:transcription antitermination factor NusA-like protein